MKTINFFILALMATVNTLAAPPKTDTIPTANGNLVIHFQGHGSLYFEYQNLLIYVDPFTKVADYSKLPKADLILVTHCHLDHYDTIAINCIRTKNTEIIYSVDCERLNPLKGKVLKMKNGDSSSFKNIPIKAVPAYNILSKRKNGKIYHPKGDGNGYVISIGGKKIYIAGDTENIPEMKNLSAIDIAFLPMNQPYTMTPEQAADAAKMVRPKIFYPYHFGETDLNKIVELLKKTPNIEVRIRDMK